MGVSPCDSLDIFPYSGGSKPPPYAWALVHAIASISFPIAVGVNPHRTNGMAVRMGVSPCDSLDIFPYSGGSKPSPYAWALVLAIASISFPIAVGVNPHRMHGMAVRMGVSPCDSLDIFPHSGGSKPSPYAWALVLAIASISFPIAVGVNPHRTHGP